MLYGTTYQGGQGGGIVYEVTRFKNLRRRIPVKWYVAGTFS
jgi:hypothetical protein